MLIPPKKPQEEGQAEAPQVKKGAELKKPQNPKSLKLNQLKTKLMLIPNLESLMNPKNLIKQRVD
ncbi:MAG: hypothetical protein Ct9H300mP28_10670 [Pseudomonadota bacterium]|nr:MAG: hypothetical protein Ct9H300mP28_10670 [Pseudomonadota bacterium]